MNYTYLFDAAWLLLGGWIVALAAFSVIAFGKDLLQTSSGQQPASSKQR